MSTIQLYQIYIAKVISFSSSVIQLEIAIELDSLLGIARAAQSRDHGFKSRSTLDFGGLLPITLVVCF